MYEAILFDLDGTLLGLDNDAFVKVYFKALAPKLAPLYGNSDFTKPIIAATEAMYRADGRKPSLRQVFCDEFDRHSAIPFEKIEPVFIDFYQHEFEQVKAISRVLPLSAPILAAAAKVSEKIVLATVPVFPRIAIDARLRWAGLERLPFTLITSFENMSFCKPNSKYYQEIAERLVVEPQRCLMIGNDHIDDLAAAGAGMETFLVLDEQLNADKGRNKPTYTGRQEELLVFLQKQVID